MTKKLPTPKKIKKLEKQCKQLCDKIVRTRDDDTCQLHKYFPNIDLACSGYMQADHGITRACKKYIFDTRNLTWVCGSANRAKHYKNKSADEGIRQVVIGREGQQFWNEMVQFNMSKEPFLGWKKIWWLEDKVEELEMEYQYILKKKGLLYDT